MSKPKKKLYAFRLSEQSIEKLEAIRNLVTCVKFFPGMPTKLNTTEALEHAIYIAWRQLQDEAVKDAAASAAVPAKKSILPDASKQAAREKHSKLMKGATHGKNR